MNCAQQYGCTTFGVQGTPTIRIIYPHTTEHSNARYGINVEPTNLAHFWKTLVLHHLEILQRDSQHSLDGLPNLQSFK